MSNVLLLHPVPVISAARRRPLILGMPPAQFVLRVVFALVIGFAWAMVLPRVVMILAEQAVLASFPR